MGWLKAGRDGEVSSSSEESDSAEQGSGAHMSTLAMLLDLLDV